MSATLAGKGVVNAVPMRCTGIAAKQVRALVDDLNEEVQRVHRKAQRTSAHTMKELHA